MTLAAEAETVGVYGNGQGIIAIRISLQALGHPTPLKTNNSTSNSFVHANIKERHSKTWDMRWNLLRDKSYSPATPYVLGQRNRQHCRLFTKHHPPSHHLAMRPKYVLISHQVTTLTHFLGDTDRYKAVTSSKHLKHQWLSTIAKPASQSISPHDLLS